MMGIYPKEGNTDTSYATINPYNFKLIFTHKQLVISIQVTVLFIHSLHIVTVIDLNTLYWDIYTALPNDLTTAKHNLTKGL